MSTEPRVRRSPHRPAIARAIATLTTFTAVGSLTALLAACPGSLENKDAFTGVGGGGGGCGDVPTVILGPRCATSNCHDADQPANNLDLTPDAGLVARLVGVPGDQCMDPLIDPTSPADSLVYTKCLPSPACGAQMPFTGDALTQTEEQCLLEWVTSVAQQ